MTAGARTEIGARRGIAVVAVTKGGATLAAELAPALGPDVELHVAARWAGEAGPSARPFEAPLGEHLARLFPRVGGIVLVLALGATVRLIAPLLSSKRNDPAVVVVDEAGRHAVSVVGGHAGGANRLAEQVAEALGAFSVITTASEVLGLPALDLLGREHGWQLEAAPGTLTHVSAAAVNGEPIAIFQDAGERGWLEQVPWDWPRMETLDDLARWDGPGLVVTDVDFADRWSVERQRWLIYRPRSLVVGIGCSTGTSADEIAGLVRSTLAEAGLSSRSVAMLATIDRRLDEPGLREIANRWGVPLVGFRPDELAGLTDVPNPSAVVAAHVGTPGVCEPAAVLASDDGDLIVPKRKSASATVAVARRRFGVVSAAGSLTVVGLGPGSPDLMTPAARRALRTADAAVGYRGYLEPLRAMLAESRLHAYELGQEAERARAAIELARRGKRVALVSSGDAGIYGMAGLVFELLGQDELTPPPVEVVPGVTAASAAAALLGAPLMLDFAVISLSDLLVDWETIERRLAAAAAGDFVVVLYNPASARRRQGLERARAVLLEHRPPTTPVGLVRDAYRAEQSVRITSLADLTPEAADMKTVIVVGNSGTTVLNGRMVTRRGYVGRPVPDAH